MPIKLLCRLSEMVLKTYKEAIPSYITCCSVYFKRKEMGKSDYKLKTAYWNIQQIYAAVYTTLKGLICWFWLMADLFLGGIGDNY